MNKFTTLTPDNINELSEREILDLVEDKPGLPSKRNRLEIIKMVYEILGFDLSNDILLTLLAENKAQLCLATAGGGKTTFAQIKIVLEKLWRKSKNIKSKKIDGNNILCLVYNKHNKKDMIEKQRQFVAKINLSTPDSINLDDKINACTMHAFCNLWRGTYVIPMGLANYNLITEKAIESLFQTSLRVNLKKFDLDGGKNSLSIENINVDNLIQLYNYQRETMLDLEDLTNTDNFIDLGLSIDFIKSIFDSFNALKTRKRVYDFTDMLKCFYDLISTNKEVLKNIQSFYDYIVADEVQDFTPIMWKILHLLVSDGTPLLCIGDEDQNIYSFRGADIYNTIKFNENFNDSATFLLSHNRRCREKILNAARNVISKNTLRFNKKLSCVKSGGEIEFVPYVQQQGSYFKLLNQIKKMGNSELESTVIAYREKDTSAIFIEYLANADIPFYVISGYKPYSHELYKHLFNILDLMEMPADSHCLLNLYKVLPISKADNYRLLDYDPKTFTFGKNYVRSEFKNIEYGKFYGYRGFSNVMQELVNISDMIESAPMKKYFPLLFYYFKMYFWEYKKKINNNPIDDVFEEYVYNLFNTDLTYEEFSNKMQFRRDLLNRYAETQTGLAVSTFHGLKGLEFDTVFLINLDNDIFPNYSLIDSKEYPDNLKLVLKESERRLFYVALTRAKNKLVLYYNESNPTLFLRDIFDLENAEGENNDTLCTMSLFNDEHRTQSGIMQKTDNDGNDIQNSGSCKKVDEPALKEENDNFLNSFMLDGDESSISLDGMELNFGFKTDYDLRNEIEQDLGSITNVELGDTMQDVTSKTSLATSVLPKLNLSEIKDLKETEHQEKKSESVNKDMIELKAEEGTIKISKNAFNLGAVADNTEATSNASILEKPDKEETSFRSKDSFIMRLFDREE